MLDELKLTAGAPDSARTLLHEIDHDCRRYLKYARGNYFMVQLLFWGSATLSASAAILGFVDPPVSGKWIGGLAALSALVAVLGRQSGLQQRANWHYRRADRLRALSRLLRFAQPQPPTAASVEAVAEHLSKLEIEMTAEFERLQGVHGTPATAHPDKTD